MASEIISFVDAFSGAGGLTIGLSKAGMTPLLSFDNDPRAIATLRANPEHIQHKTMQVDATELVPDGLLSEIGMKAGELDVLVGGPPCQGFSVQRIGKSFDARNDLVIVFGQLVEQTLPRLFLMENVPGLTGRRGRPILDMFLENMSKAGYLVHSAILDAQDYGVPQRRRRLILVGERNNGVINRFQFPEPDSTRRITVRDTIGKLPETPLDCTDHPMYPRHRRDRLSEVNKQRLAALEQSQGRQHLPSHLLADCHQVDSKVIGHRNVYGRMPWDDVAPTITARFDSFTRGQFGHPDQLRSISVYEGALIQTFPEDYTFVGTKVEAARQVGNAVPPRLGKALGKSLVQSLTPVGHQ